MSMGVPSVNAHKDVPIFAGVSPAFVSHDGRDGRATPCCRTTISWAGRPCHVSGSRGLCGVSVLARLRRTHPLMRMKVSFTTKEYARLLELVNLGLYVAGARPDDPATMPERYGAIAQKAFGLAETFGCAELVEVDVNGQFYPGEKLTQGPSGERLEAFAEDLFWAELTGRLAERDLRADLGAKAETELGEEEATRLQALEDGYWREFEANGVNHLVVLRGGQG